MSVPKNRLDKYHRPASFLSMIIAISFVLALMMYRSELGLTGFGNVTPLLTSPGRSINSEEGEQIFLMRRAGLMDDHSKAQWITAIIQDPANLHPLIVSTALHALAQLGETEALPTFDLIAKKQLVDADYLKVMRQRLIAENRAAKDSDRAKKAETKIDSFCSGLGLSPLHLSAGAPPPFAPTEEKPTSLEVLEMREIEDMVYRGNYADYAAVLNLKQISSTSDAPSALKIRLAPLSRVERVQTLIDDLAKSRILGDQQEHELQLVDDEGILASRTAAAKLKYMDRYPRDYPREGFDAIFAALCDAGDSTQANLVKHYTHDKDPYIAYLAKNDYPDVKIGHHGVFAPSY